MSFDLILGRETARSLAFHGAHVILACRNLELAKKAVAEIQKERVRTSLYLALQ